MKSTRPGWIAAKPGERKATWYCSLANSEWAHFLSADAQAGLANVAAEDLACWGDLCPLPHFIDESNFVGLMVENLHPVTIAGDLLAMVVPVEFRSPFLDQEMVSFGLVTPAEKIPGLKNTNGLKAILGEVVSDLMPDTLLKAPKQGFGMGIQEANVLRRPWRQLAGPMLESADDAQGMFDSALIRAEWQGFIAGTVSANRVAKMLAIQIWLRAETSNASQ